MRVIFENNHVKVRYGEDGRFLKDLGTRLPDDEQLARVIMRAIEFGKQLKVAEINAVLGH